jgi:hypothetical protein
MKEGGEIGGMSCIQGRGEMHTGLWFGNLSEYLGIPGSSWGVREIGWESVSGLIWDNWWCPVP